MLAEPKVALPACGIEYCQPGDEGLYPVGEHMPHVQAILEENQNKDDGADDKDSHQPRAIDAKRDDNKSEKGEEARRQVRKKKRMRMRGYGDEVL